MRQHPSNANIQLLAQTVLILYILAVYVLHCLVPSRLLWMCSCNVIHIHSRERLGLGLYTRAANSNLNGTVLVVWRLFSRIIMEGSKVSYLLYTPNHHYYIAGQDGTMWSTSINTCLSYWGGIPVPVLAWSIVTVLVAPAARFP